MGRIQTNMKLQTAVLFACLASVASANIQQQAQAKVNSAIDQAQQVLNKNNVDFNVADFTQQIFKKIETEAKAQNYQSQADKMVKDGKKQVKDALKKSGLSQNVQKNLLNLLKNVEVEAKKALNNN